jgi:hypothetical protein
MADLSNRKLIYLKGFLFLAGILLSALIILLEHPQWKVAVLLGIAIWCSARFYYFVFYVIEHYVDDRYKFSGLVSFIRYLLQQKGREK